MERPKLVPAQPFYFSGLTLGTWIRHMRLKVRLGQALSELLGLVMLNLSGWNGPSRQAFG